MKLCYTLTETATAGQCEAPAITFGRSSAVEVRLDHDFISRRHAVLREESGRFLIEDQGSDNGTFVNGQRIDSPAAVTPGDRIQLGNPGPEIRIDRLEPSAGAAGETAGAAAPKQAAPAHCPPPFTPESEWGRRAPAVPAVSSEAGRPAEAGEGAPGAKRPFNMTTWQRNAIVAGAATAALLLLATWLWHANTHSLPRLFQQIDPATVKIHTTDSRGKPGSGSGFFVDPRGWVVTNFHVAAGSTGIEVELHDGTRVPVTGFIASSPVTDLAILKIDPPPEGVRTLRLCRNPGTPPPPGTDVCVVGHPLGLRKSLSPGTVSSPPMSGREFRRWAQERNLEVDALIALHLQDDVTWIQTNAAVSRGSSGGPLLNRRAEVVGVVTRSIGGEGTTGIHFASAVKHLKRLIDDADGQVHPLSDLTPGGSN